MDEILCSVKLFNSEMSRRSMNYDTALATISRNVFARTKTRPRFASLWYVFDFKFVTFLLGSDWIRSNSYDKQLRQLSSAYFQYPLSFLSFKGHTITVFTVQTVAKAFIIIYQFNSLFKNHLFHRNLTQKRTVSDNLKNSA